MTLRADTQSASDLRAGRRANVFLSGVLHFAGSSLPVRIRNLSATGALAEGDDMPAAASAVRLQRGPYSAPATIVWKDHGSCGLRFESAVPAEEWIAYGRGHKGQQRVDSILAAARSGSGVPGGAHSPAPAVALTRAQTAEQLGTLATELQQIGTDLASSTSLADKDIAALQKLDILTQRLAGLSAMLGSGAG